MTRLLVVGGLVILAFYVIMTVVVTLAPYIAIGVVIYLIAKFQPNSNDAEFSMGLALSYRQRRHPAAGIQ